MNCSEFLAHLDDLIDNTLSVPTRAELEEHLRGCEHCVITLNTTRKTIEIYRKHEIYELPNDLRDRLQKAILAKCKKC
ncbi:MAG TPA: zf-HC2 domain-containing protein [Silvibacterium sp.]|nr:zf-HC2 domain-containing protein [Silvibacterium sp.]